MTDKKTIQGWFEEGRKQHATHMIVVCDTFDFEDYPVYVSMKENVHEVKAKYDSKDMQKVMEVYRIEDGNMEEQLAMHRAFVY